MEKRAKKQGRKICVKIVYKTGKKQALKLDKATIRFLVRKKIKEVRWVNGKKRITLNLKTLKKGRKKYDHSKDDLTPLTKETKKTQSIQPDVIENNLFRQEEEKKEDETKEVLQLEHAMIVEK